MPLAPQLQEKRRNLHGLRVQQSERFAKTKRPDISDADKHGVLEEIKRAEPDILKLHNEVVEEERFLISEQQNDAALKALNEADPTTPFSVRDAARSPLGTQIDNDHRRALGELIANSEAVKSFNTDRAKKSIRTAATEFSSFKSLADGFWNPRGRSEIIEAIDTLSPEEKRSLKATFGTTGLTSIDRQGELILQGVQPNTIADLIPQGETSSTTVRYLREMAFTPAAAAVAEGGLKPEATWNLAEIDAQVRKIAVTAKVVDELLEDFPALRDYLNARLPFMVAIEEDNQLLNGSGTSPNLRGILNTTGILLHAQGFDVDETTAVAGDTAPDALLRAATRVQFESQFEPTGIVMNPFRWMNIRLMRSGTGDGAGGAGRGLYLFGNPSEPGPDSLWGYPIRRTTRIATNKAVVAAWNLGAMIFRKKGITVDITNANEDDFKYNRTAMRAEERLAFAMLRPQAFCVTTFA